MYIGYLIYQAERPRSAAERRTEDINRGEFAKALSRVLRGRGHAGPAAPVTAERPAFSAIRGNAPTAVPAACVPAQRDGRTACRPA